MGICLRVVQQDLEHGYEFLPEMPPLKPLREIRIGGIVDTTTRSLVGRSTRPLVWYIGDRQCEVLLDDPTSRDESTRTLLLAAEGAGKSTLASQWTLLQVVRCAELGVRGFAGATAPTARRLRTLVERIGDLVPLSSPIEPKPGAWGDYFVADSEIRFKSGITIQLRTTKRQSAATGSPVQGYTWRWS